jgi:bacterioferritin
MCATKDIVPCLNNLLKNRLTAINQHFLHARMLKHEDELELADYEFKASLEAMKHADILVEYILACGGIPNLQELGKLTIGQTSEEMLRNDLMLTEMIYLETGVIMRVCENSSDKKTAAMLARMRASQRDHIHEFQLRLAARIPNQFGDVARYNTLSRTYNL